MVIKVSIFMRSLSAFLFFIFWVNVVVGEMKSGDEEFDRAAVMREIRTVYALHEIQAIVNKALLKRVDEGEDLDLNVAHKIYTQLKDARDFKDHAMRVIEEMPSDDLALEAIRIVVMANSVYRDKNSPTLEFMTNTSEGEIHKEMADLILKYHLNRPKIMDIYLRLSDRDKINYLQEVYQSSSDRYVRGNAAIRLVDHYLFLLRPVGLDKAWRQSLQKQAVSYLEIIRKEYTDIMPSIFVGIPRSLRAGKSAEYRGPETPKLGALAESRMNTLLNSAGQDFPNLKATEISGINDQIMNYNDKIVLVDFWATWCGPCKQGHPYLIALKEEMAGRPFEIIGISVDENMEDVVGYVEENQLPWVQWYVGPNDHSLKRLGVLGFPTYFLVDTDGVIQARGGSSILSDNLSFLADKLVTEVEGSDFSN